MNAVSRIEPIGLTDLTPAQPVTGSPIFEWVDPRTLFVDHSYQRVVGERGLRQIRNIVRRFDWRRFKPPICAYGEHEGATILKVLDGQHTAIAAASNPHIETIPVMIVDAPDIEAQAAAFVGQNTERLGITALQLHQAAVVSGDPEAATVEQVCERAGVKIVKSIAGGAAYRPRETIAVSTLRWLIDRHTAQGARKILEVLANAELAPITTHHIKAAELLLSDPEFSMQFEPEDLQTAIADMFLTAEDAAKVYAHAHRLPFFKALAIVWFRKTKKKRRLIRAVA